MRATTETTRVYYLVFVALAILAGATALISRIDLGPFNVTVALIISLIKATLVALFFMHVRQSRRLIALVIFASLVWLTILLTLTMADYGTRSWTMPVRGLQ